MDENNNNKRIIGRMIDTSLNVEIPLTSPMEHKLIQPVSDFSQSGISFLMRNEDGFLSQGTLINNIRVFNSEYEEFIPESKVIYCNPHRRLDGKENYKIGIQFINHSSIIQKRPTRFNGSFLEGFKTEISFEYLDGQTSKAKLLDFSQNGISMSVGGSISLISKSNTIKNLDISIDGRNIYHGSGFVIDIFERRDTVVLRVALKDSYLPIDDILLIREQGKVKNSKKSLSSLILLSDIVDPNFKAAVGDLRHFLESIKKILDKFEADTMRDEPGLKKELAREFLQEIEQDSFNKLNLFLSSIYNVTASLDQSQYEKCGEYYRTNLHSLLLEAPFINRVYNKPLGYAGDYEMMNMIYRNDYEGKTLFGQFLHKHTLSITPAQTNRNRIPYLIRKLKSKVKKFKKDNKRIKVTNIACGPCIEIQMFMESDDLSDYVDFTVLDASRDALQFAKTKLDAIKEQYKRKTTIKYVHESIYPLIKKKAVQDLIDDNQDMIYSLGLFEYLSDITVRRLFETLYSKLASGGIMTAGNYSNENYFRAHMELGGEWFLFYRQPQDFIKLVNDLPNTKSVFIDDDGKIEFNKFLNVEKQ